MKCTHRLSRSWTWDAAGTWKTRIPNLISITSRLLAWLVLTATLHIGCETFPNETLKFAPVTKLSLRISNHSKASALQGKLLHSVTAGAPLLPLQTLLQCGKEVSSTQLWLCWWAPKFPDCSLRTVSSKLKESSPSSLAALTSALDKHRWNRLTAQYTPPV